MKIEAYRNGIYRVLRISDEISHISNLEELRSMIRCYLEKDEQYLAVSFTDASYLYSGAIAVLISCFKLISEQGGDLALIEVHPELLNLLSQMGIDTLVNVYASEADLPGDIRQIERTKTNFPGS